MPKKRGKRKSSVKGKLSKKQKKKAAKKFKRGLNVLFGTILFILLIGSAWSIDWIFGIGFMIGFAIAVYNKTLERKPLLPVFIFFGGLIIRFAIGIIFPLIIKSKDYFSLGISLILLVILIVFGMRIKKGKL